MDEPFLKPMIWISKPTLISKDLIVFRDFTSHGATTYYQVTDLKRGISPNHYLTDIEGFNPIPYKNFLAIWGKERV